jgi:hypothetical protein
MSGRKKKPCEFCETEQIISESGAGTHQLQIEFYPYQRFFSVFSFADNADRDETEELSANFEMYYCPVCGRKMF